MKNNDDVSTLPDHLESFVNDNATDYMVDNIEMDDKTLYKPGVPKTKFFTTASVYEPPQGEIEEELAQIWSVVLKVSPIGRNDSFIELGGDSLLATTVLHKIQDVFDVELPLRTIFELQTIRTIAEEIDNIYIGAIGSAIDEGVI